MDDHNDEPTEGLSSSGEGSDAWGGVGARRGPRKAAEGVRIIGAEEAAAAIESGEVASRRPEDAPRFGDVPEAPAGPRPRLRFPGADPSAVDKPPPIPQEEGDGGAGAGILGRITPGSAGGRGLWDEPPAPAEPSGSGLWDQPASSEPSFWDDRAGRRIRASSQGPTDDDLVAPAEAATDDPGAAFFGDVDQGAAAAPARSRRGSRSGDDIREPSLDEGPITDLAGGGSLPHWTEPPSGEQPRILGDSAPAQSGDDLDAWSALSTGPRWRDQATDWEDADFDDAILADQDTRVGALTGEVPVVVDDPYGFDEAAPAAEAAPASTTTRVARPQRPPAGPRPGEFVPGPSRSSSQDVPTRVITGAVAAGVVLVAAAVGPAALVVLLTVALVLAAAELLQAVRARGYHPATLLALVATASLMGGVYWRGEQALPLVLSLFVVFTMLWYLTGVVRARPAMNVAVTVMAFVYVGFLGSFAVLLLRIPDRLGITLLLGAILTTAVYDIGAFFVGRWAGKTPLAPDISPGKTFEGLVGGSFAALATGVLLVPRMHPWDAGKGFWLALIVAVLAPLGDLCESLIKRDLDVKDMGSLLPGHGGVLDRIDALLFVVPGTYYLVRILFG